MASTTDTITWISIAMVLTPIIPQMIFIFSLAPLSGTMTLLQDNSAIVDKPDGMPVITFPPNDPCFLQEKHVALVIDGAAPEGRRYMTATYTRLFLKEFYDGEACFMPH